MELLEIADDVFVRPQDVRMIRPLDTTRDGYGPGYGRASVVVIFDGTEAVKVPTNRTVAELVAALKNVTNCAQNCAQNCARVPVPSRSGQ